MTAEEFGVFVPHSMQAVWDEATATRPCPQCGARAGSECEPLGFRPHRVRYEPVEGDVT